MFITIAKLYLTYMLCVLPAEKATKRPTLPSWKAYQDRLPTESEWDMWEKTATGLCIITGKISGYLLVIDFDDHGSCFQAWCQLIPEELRNRLVGVRTPSGGYHVYLRYDTESTDLFRNSGTNLIGNIKLACKEDGTTLIETRGEGGLVIAPPTPGYEITCGSFDNIPVLKPIEVEMLLDTARSFNQKTRQPIVPQPTAPSRPSVSPVSSVDMSEAERRAIAYINAMPEAIQGNNGSNALFRVCNKLYAFGLDKDTAKRIIMEHYNPRCVPEWSEKEIDHKLDDAYNKPINEAGSMLAPPEIPDAIMNGVEELKQYIRDKKSSKKNSVAHHVTERAGAVGNHLVKSGKPSNGQVIVPKLIGGCFADVKDEFINWLWKNRLACGMLNCIHGSPDAGKGYLSFSLASIVSNGGTFPDGNTCEFGTVLILGTEEHYGYAKRKLAAQGANLRNVHYLSGYTDESGGEYSITLVNTDKVREYCAELEQNGNPRVSLIIVDPLIQMLGCRSNDNTETQAVLTPVKDLAEELDTCILFVHHDGKEVRDSAAQRALGAQSIMGKMRTGFRVSKHDDGTHSVATSKFNIGMRPKAITFIIEKSLSDPEIGVVRYLDTEGDYTADTTAQDSVQSKAARWLENFLLAGAVAMKEVLEHGEHGGGFTKDQLKKAKKKLGAVSKKVGKGKCAPWIWILPDSITGVSVEAAIENYLRDSEGGSSALGSTLDTENADSGQVRTDAPLLKSLENEG